MFDRVLNTILKKWIQWKSSTPSYRFLVAFCMFKFVCSAKGQTASPSNQRNCLVWNKETSLKTIHKPIDWANVSYYIVHIFQAINLSKLSAATVTSLKQKTLKAKKSRSSCTDIPFKKSFFKKLRKVHKKTPVLGSIF